jgi:hypothetical protein
MPDRNAKQPQNVPGRFYVDTNCIDCDVCRDLAEANFPRDDDGGYSYVYKQPETPEVEFVESSWASDSMDLIYFTDSIDSPHCRCQTDPSA